MARRNRRNGGSIKAVWIRVDQGKYGTQDLPKSGRIVRVMGEGVMPQNVLYQENGNIWGFYALKTKKLIREATHWKYLDSKEEKAEREALIEWARKIREASDKEKAKLEEGKKDVLG